MLDPYSTDAAALRALDRADRFAVQRRYAAMCERDQRAYAAAHGRPDDAAAPRVPGGEVRQVLADMVSIWSDLDALEREHHLDQLHEPDLGFAWAAYRWAMGAGLDEVLNETDLAAGDFVRWIKQLLDLAGQVADAAATSGKPNLRENARLTIGALRRGVVAYSSLQE